MGKKTEKDTDSQRTAGAADVGANIVRAAAAAALTSGPPEMALATALLSLFPSAVKLVLPFVLERKQRQFRRWWDELTFATADNAAVAAEIRSRLQEPEAQDTIFESLRTVLDTVSEEATPALGVLARSYIQAGQRADAFFRGASNVLRELSPDELRELKSMLQLVVLAETRGQGPMIGLRAFGTGTTPGFQIGIVTRDAKTGREDVTDVQRSDNAMRLFRLLKSNDLGQDMPPGFPGVASGPQVLVMQNTVARRLHELLHH